MLLDCELALHRAQKEASQEAPQATDKQPERAWRMSWKLRLKRLVTLTSAPTGDTIGWSLHVRWDERAHHAPIVPCPEPAAHSLAEGMEMEWWLADSGPTHSQKGKSTVV
jgi:hypothetical protein